MDMTEKVKGLLLSVILVVIALMLLPIVIESVGDVLAITGVSAYTGVEAFSGLIPLFVLIGIVTVAVFNTLWSMKK